MSYPNHSIESILTMVNPPLYIYKPYCPLLQCDEPKMIEPHLHYQILSRTPTIHNPPRVIHSDPTATTIPSPMAPSPLSGTSDSSPTANHDAILTALYRYMQSNEPYGAVTEITEADDEFAIPIDGAYASADEFRMYEFKVRPCTRARAHDWTECPFAHPGEKARRRDPRRYPYSGTACTDFRKGGCMRGDTCEFAHGVFECWLHPARYRTQACKDGPSCTRRVCFFAHSPDQLRVISGLPSPRSIGSGADPFDDPDSPSSPGTPTGRAYGSGTINELVASLRNLQLSRMQSGWKVQVGMNSPRFGSAAGRGLFSLPTTPTRPGGPEYWEAEEPVMERVESGRELRARMFEKISKENPLTLPDPPEPEQNVGWVTELVN